jgi:hypothetical protein
METSMTVKYANACRQEVLCNYENGDRLLVIRGIFNMRNNSWELADEMAMIDTILKGLPCPPIYIFQDQKHPMDHVFDGAHRFETSCGFVSNDIMIKQVRSNSIVWDTSPLKRYIGKYFRDLTPEDKAKISNYKFLIHVLDPTLAENPEELAALWVRLNNSGSKLNQYEMYKPIYHVFYALLETESQSWLGTHLNPAPPPLKPGSKKKEKPKRGEPEEQLMKLLALSEPAAPANFSSTPDMYKKWRTATFGKTSDVVSNFEAKKTHLDARLKHLRDVYAMLEKHKILDEKPNEIILLTLIGRIARWCQARPMLTRCETRLVEYATLMLDMPSPEMASILGCGERNGPYQKRLMYRIDRDIHDIVEQLDDPRLFTPTQQMMKLKEQGGVCPECEKPIEWGQKYEGHHDKPYSQGGPTTLANLRVLHTECHMALHARS